MFVEHKEVGEVQPHRENASTPLKLSAAIRIGALMHPQGRHLVYSHGKTCALGAAIAGRGGDLGREDYEYRESVLPDVWGTPLAEEIIARNDFNGWTREQIADWLESKGL
jgi:hypothetical protein